MVDTLGSDAGLESNVDEKHYDNDRHKAEKLNVIGLIRRPHVNPPQEPAHTQHLAFEVGIHATMAALCKTAELVNEKCKSHRSDGDAYRNCHDRCRRRLCARQQTWE